MGSYCSFNLKIKNTNLDEITDFISYYTKQPCVLNKPNTDGSMYLSIPLLRDSIRIEPIKDEEGSYNLFAFGGKYTSYENAIHTSPSCAVVNRLGEAIGNSELTILAEEGVEPHPLADENKVYKVTYPEKEKSYEKATIFLGMFHGAKIIKYEHNFPEINYEEWIDIYKNNYKLLSKIAQSPDKYNIFNGICMNDISLGLPNNNMINQMTYYNMLYTIYQNSNKNIRNIDLEQVAYNDLYEPLNMRNFYKGENRFDIDVKIWKNTLEYFNYSPEKINRFVKTSEDQKQLRDIYDKHNYTNKLGSYIGYKFEKDEKYCQFTPSSPISNNNIWSHSLNFTISKQGNNPSKIKIYYLTYDNDKMDKIEHEFNLSNKREIEDYLINNKSNTAEFYSLAKACGYWNPDITKDDFKKLKNGSILKSLTGIDTERVYNEAYNKFKAIKDNSKYEIINNNIILKIPFNEKDSVKTKLFDSGYNLIPKWNSENKNWEISANVYLALPEEIKEKIDEIIEPYAKKKSEIQITEEDDYER